MIVMIQRRFPPPRVRFGRGPVPGLIHGHRAKWDERQCPPFVIHSSLSRSISNYARQVIAPSKEGRYAQQQGGAPPLGAMGRRHAKSLHVSVQRPISIAITPWRSTWSELDRAWGVCLQRPTSRRCVPIGHFPPRQHRWTLAGEGAGQTLTTLSTNFPTLSPTCATLSPTCATLSPTCATLSPTC